MAYDPRVDMISKYSLPPKGLRIGCFVGACRYLQKKNVRNPNGRMGSDLIRKVEGGVMEYVGYDLAELKIDLTLKVGQGDGGVDGLLKGKTYQEKFSHYALGSCLLSPFEDPNFDAARWLKADYYLFGCHGYSENELLLPGYLDRETILLKREFGPLPNGDMRHKVFQDGFWDVNGMPGMRLKLEREPHPRIRHCQDYVEIFAKHFDPVRPPDLDGMVIENGTTPSEQELRDLLARFRANPKSFLT